MPCQPINYFFNFHFFETLTMVPKRHNLALNCAPNASLVEKCSTGCFGCSTDVESGPLGKVDALSVKMSVPMSETYSLSEFYYTLKIFN